MFCASRPLDFKAKRLERGSKGIALTAWIQEINFRAESRGFDTLFRVYDPNLLTEFYLLERWGDVSDKPFENELG